MPIYAYQCATCGHSKDVLQKMSDAPLTECPACGAQAFSKQLTAAGFQLKGSGWYATDFKGGGAPAPAATSPTESTAATPAATSTTPPTTPASAAPASASNNEKPSSGESKAVASDGCGTGCACH